MKNSKKIICSIIFLFVIFSTNFVHAEENANIYKSSEKQEAKGNVTYAQEVTSDMSNTSYWANKLGKEADRLILNTNEIEKINQEIIDGSGTLVYDITSITEEKTQIERQSILAHAIEDDFNYMVRNYPDKDRKLYVDGELIDNIPYIENLKNAVLTTGFENDEEKIQLYAVGVKRTEVKMFPTKSIWGYDSPDDPDDEACNSTIEVNEPFLIRAKCTVGEDTFYWGLTNDCTGWVNAADLAIFDSKKEWLDTWKVDVKGKDFLVITQDNIILESSTSAPETSEVQLKLGTILKLVPENEIPESVNARGTLNNYVVYLPTRNEEGKYIKNYALIAEHYQVSIGYLPLTQRNILDVAFTCLGNRYGWGGMLGAMDCSAYAKAIYKCFGLKLPRNTTNQQNVPNRVVSLAEMSDEEKEKYIEKLPVGSMLFFPGHVTVYIGSENGKNYVISDTGSLSDSYGEVNVRTMYSVIMNPLTVRRRNENTWLTSVTKALIFGEMPRDEEQEEEPKEDPADESINEISEQDVYVTSDEDTKRGNLTYANGVFRNMVNSTYWKNLLNEKDRQLLNSKEIEELNIQMNGKNSNDLNSKSILVVAQDKIVLEPSISQPEISEVKLLLGTVLELVPEDKIPTNLAERGPWNNYVVYLPVTNENGKVEKKYALIPEHYQVSTGYLSLTPENIIEVAFRCLGDSYELMNNTNFIESVYKCFGLELSINSEVNIKLKDKVKDFSNMSIAEKKQSLKDIQVGSILKIGNEYAIYLGNQNENYYIVSSMDGKINSIVLTRVELEKLVSVIDFAENNTKKENENIVSKQYEVIEGNDQIIEYGNDAIFRINADYKLFTASGKAYVDDTELNTNQYSSREGSTIITLNSDYLNTLSKGEHTLKVAFVDGEASTKFTLKDSNKEIKNSTTNDTKTDFNITSTKNPKTGDDITMWICLMVVSMIGIVGLIGTIKLKQRKIQKN